MIATPALVADCLVNLFGAAGAILLARQARRADPHGPVTRRIVFALWFVAVLFLVRVTSWIWAHVVTDFAAVLMASATPLVSLIVAEGLVRRHAPQSLKIALVGAPFVVAVLWLAPGGWPDLANAALMASVTGGFAAIAVLLYRRDRAGLSMSENAAAAGVLSALLLLTALIATDFRSLWPDIPVRLGALGTLVLLYIGLGSGNLHATLKARGINVAVFAASAAVLGLGLSMSIGEVAAADLIRLVAVVMAVILFAVLWVQNHHEEGTRTLATLVSATTPQAFSRLVEDHPLFGGAHVLSATALEHVLHPAFTELFETQPTLRLAGAPWGRSANDPGVERALSLMTAYEATHLAMISLEPLRLITFSLPPTAGDARTESLLEVARLVAEVVHLKADRT